MGSADAYNAYLQKHAIGNQLISVTPDPQLHTIIAIPAYNESGLTTCLDSLFHCDPPLAPTEVIILINSAKNSSRETVAANRRNYAEVREWIEMQRLKVQQGDELRLERQQGEELQGEVSRIKRQQEEWQQEEGSQEKLQFHVVLVEELPDKHFGAGLARKLVMDEAVRRLAGRAAKEKVSGIIVSLDADTVVRRDYLRAVEDHFSRHPQASGCSISFEHPLSRQEYEHRTPQNPPPENFPPEAFEAVANYELHQRYYLLAVRYTGYPYAYHTVGSCFAVQVEAYCRAGGMSRRKAGEDFYFIQKLAAQGGFTECRSTRVYPSPRPSDRVPFGTGPDISRQLSTQLLPYLTYHPELFEHLRKFFALIPRFYRSGKAAAAANGDPPTGTKREAPEDNAAAARDGDPPVGSEKAAVQKGVPPVGKRISTVPEGVPPVLGRYLEESGFWEELEEIRGNTASEEAFRKRFFNKFNMFRILKYLHFAEEHGVEKMEVTAAAGMMLELWQSAHGAGTPGIPTGSSTREMLLLYRKYFG